MEMEEVKQATADFLRYVEVRAGSRLSFSIEESLFYTFLSQVLGYDDQGEVVIVPAPERKIRLPVRTDHKIKFLLYGTRAKTPSVADLAEKAMWVALYHRTSLFALLNFPLFRLYGVLQEKNAPELELMMELSLQESELDSIALQLWTISKKDCGKKVLLYVDDLL